MEEEERDVSEFWSLLLRESTKKEWLKSATADELKEEMFLCYVYDQVVIVDIEERQVVASLSKKEYESR